MNVDPLPASLSTEMEPWCACMDSLAHGCEVAGGDGPALLVDGAVPTYGWLNGTTPALVVIAPGPHELTARCRDCL